jgi:hypothetical protein
MEVSLRLRVTPDTVRTWRRRFLERDIRAWLADWNEHPRPFVRTKTADQIRDKVAAYCRRSLTQITRDL